MSDRNRATYDWAETPVMVLESVAAVTERAAVAVVAEAAFVVEATPAAVVLPT